MIDELTVVHIVAESTVGLRPNELGTDRGRSGHNLSSWPVVWTLWKGCSSLDTLVPQATLTSNILLALVSLRVAWLPLNEV